MTIKVYNGLKYDGKEIPDRLRTGWTWSLRPVCVREGNWRPSEGWSKRSPRFLLRTLSTRLRRLHSCWSFWCCCWRLITKTETNNTYPAECHRRCYVISRPSCAVYYCKKRRRTLLPGGAPPSLRWIISKWWIYSVRECSGSWEAVRDLSDLEFGDGVDLQTNKEWKSTDGERSQHADRRWGTDPFFTT